MSLNSKRRHTTGRERRLRVAKYRRRKEELAERDILEADIALSRLPTASAININQWKVQSTGGLEPKMDTTSAEHHTP